MKKKNNSRSNIKILKLTCGDSIICHADRTGDTYTITSPMQMVHMPMFSKNGQVNGTEICFRDWIEGSIEDKFVLPASAVLIETFPERTIRVLYEKMVKEGPLPFTEGDMQIANDIVDSFNKMVEKGHTGPPPQERIDEDEEDTDDGWGDVPPRFKM